MWDGPAELSAEPVLPFRAAVQPANFGGSGIDFGEMPMRSFLLPLLGFPCANWRRHRPLRGRAETEGRNAQSASVRQLCHGDR